MTDRQRAPSAVRTAVVWDVLRRVLSERSTVTGRASLDVLDAGGGTGGFAVPLAELGHAVTVVDPSLDSLAALERRAAEAGVTAHVRAVQGDTEDLLALVGEGSVDLVLCHSVLEVVDDPLEALTAVVCALRGGGTVSVLAANRTGAVIHRALAGRFDEARRALLGPDGRWGDTDPAPRRFTLPDLTRLLEDAGLRVGMVHGVRLFTDLVPGDLVPGGFVDGEPAATESLLALEAAAAEHSDLWGVATQLHLLGRKGGEEEDRRSRPGREDAGTEGAP